MKRSRAVHHVEALAQECARLVDAPPFVLPVVELWAFGPVLEQERDLDGVTVAVCVDRPVDEVPWLSEPPGAQHWANMTRMAKNPISPRWRSVHAPVWNHEIVRPLLLWTRVGGVRDDAVSALRDGGVEPLRAAAVGAEELRARLHEEQAVSLRALRARTKEYDDRRWAPGKQTTYADALWQASAGYLDLLDALSSQFPDPPAHQDHR